MLTSRFSSFALIFLLLISWSCQKDNNEPTVNLPPKYLGESFLTATADEAFSYKLEVEDPEGLDIQISVLDKPEWISYDAGNRELNGTPSRDDAGLNSVDLEISDGVNTINRELKISVVIELSFAELLQQNLEEAYATLTPDLAGVSVAVSKPDGMLTTANFGSSHFSQVRPIEDHHQYRVASISKTFTAALILKMVEAGHLDLDETLDTYLLISGLEYGDQMTIRQLLSHTAGVFDHLNSSTFWNDPNNYSTKVWHHDEIFQFAVDAGAYFPPGEGYAYSNTGFYILGAVAEKLLGEDLTDIFESWVFEPLGLENTFYDDFSMMGNTIDNLAESERAYDYHLSAAGAAGAIVSTPSDIAKFGKALYEGDFLSQDHIDAMLINIGAPLGGSDYGLGTRLWDDFGIYHYGHTGSLMDYRNIMMHVPDKSITIAIHANDVHENWFDLVNQVLLTTVNAF
jgi:CubicO group peptidase (beta-lactamase class C family)